MASKTKNKLESEKDANKSTEELKDKSEREMLLQEQYETLTDNLNTLKIKVEQLRRENEFLQNETDNTRMESKEYISYLSKRAEKMQNAIVTVGDQSRLDLEELRAQKQKMKDEHEKQSNELKREILQKENELALLNDEITHLSNLKTIQQQQMCRIAELENELTVMQSFHSESLVALKGDFLEKRKKYKQQANDKLQAVTTSAIRESSRCLVEHMEKVYEENSFLKETLQQLVQRYHALQRQQDLLQKQQQRLLMERKFAKGLQCQRFSLQPKSVAPNRKTPPHTATTYN